jgi:hypothetical protein
MHKLVVMCSFQTVPCNVHMDACMCCYMLRSLVGIGIICARLNVRPGASEHLSGSLHQHGNLEPQVCCLSNLALCLGCNSRRRSLQHMTAILGVDSSRNWRAADASTCCTGDWTLASDC